MSFGRLPYIYNKRKNQMITLERNLFMGAKELIIEGKTALGIELGSTRIKGVLIDYQGNVLAVGIHDWENSFIDNICHIPCGNSCRSA